MSSEFPANPSRFDPYKNDRFLMFVGTSTTPVPAIRSISRLAWNTQVIPSREDGAGNYYLLGSGLTTFEPLVITRGLTQDRTFLEWASEVFVIDNGAPSGPSLANMRKEVMIAVLNEEAQQVMRFKLHRCWPSSYSPIGPLDANNPGVLIESITLQYEGFERDLTLVEAPEN